MKFLELVYPGIGFSVALILFVLCLTQLDLYFRKALHRSRDLALFCLASSLFAFNIYVVYSKRFSHDFMFHYVVDFQFILPSAFYFYMKSMAYYVAIPNWLQKLYLRGMVVIGLLFLLPPVLRILFGINLSFEPDTSMLVGNFFVDSYTLILGNPKPFPRIVLGAVGALNIFATSVLFYRVAKTSVDIFLMGGVAATFLASFFDIFLLPYTLSYYVPVLFLSNIFEAFRMCFLASMEALRISSKKDEREKNGNFEVSSLDDERLDSLTGRLIHLFESDKIYLDSAINLEGMARAMKIPSYQLSQVIRFGMKSNFSDLVNQSRIEEIKKRLKDPDWDGKTILDVAYSCGFNSKSTFNTAFKKQVGMTPSQFRKSE